MGQIQNGIRDASDIALIVLAAGYGTRFGHGDKLAQPLDGRPLAHHVLETVDRFRWGRRILVCRGSAEWVDGFRARGFAVRINDDRDSGMLGSVHVGLDAAQGFGRVAIFLADMPLIDQEHIGRLIDLSAASQGRIVASKGGTYRGPPAIIPVDNLRNLPRSGEGGARSLLQGALFVESDAAHLRDVDTVEDLRGLRP